MSHHPLALRSVHGLGALLAAATMLGGCTAAPTSDDLGLEEHEVGMRLGSWADTAPERQAVSIAGGVSDDGDEPERDDDDDGDEPERDHDDEDEDAFEGHVGPPRVVVSELRDADDGWPEGHGTALCPFDVQTLGFPAVTEDGTTVAYAVSEVLSSADGEDELVTVRWLDVETDSHDETIVVVDGEDFKTDHHCLRLWRRARVLAGQVNDKLSGQRWRPLRWLPVDTIHAAGDSDAYEFRDDPSAVPGSERRVELVYRHDEAIVRIPGVAVLGRRPADWYASDSDDFCGFSPVAIAVYGDPVTGVAVAEVGQEAAPCFCYSETLFHAIDMESLAFELIEERNVELGC